MSMLRQARTVTALSLQTLPSRFWPSFSTVLSVGLVVAVLIAFLAMSNGFSKALNGTGSDTVAFVTRAGSDAEINSVISREQQRLLEEAPGVALGADGEPLVSPELYVIVDGFKRSSGSPVNLPMRGVGPKGPPLRTDFEIIEGRMFDPGTNEIIVGRGALREFTGFELGQEVRFATTTWRIVGVFGVGGSVFESELWADLGVVQNLFNRGSTVQTVRAQLVNDAPATLETFKDYLADDPRLQLDATTEQAYYAGQSDGLATLVFFGWAIAITLSFGALAGAINTMNTAIEARAREMATLRAIGFGGFSAFAAAMVESLLLSVLGGLLGAVGAFLIFDGLSASTLGGNFTQVVFSFAVGPELVVNGLIIAVLIGLIGGFPPALAAARQQVLKLGAR